jgi:hypothetical protein
VSPRAGDNLYDRWDLDPGAGPQAITERLRELAESADALEQAELRRAWEELTVHPRRRIVEALGAHPETRPPLGRPPLPLRPPAADPRDATPALAHAPVAAALGALPAVPSALPPLDGDPRLAARSASREGGPS